MTVISCEQLSKKYDDFLALDDINLEIEKGDFFGLLGPNGAGKTTLLKILTGQLKPTTGMANVSGIDIQKEILEVKKKISIVPEQESPPSFLTPREVLEMVCSIREIKNPEIEKWIEFFELEEMEGKVCRNLSRGQRQKVMLGAAFIAKTNIMFLDEPFINLDPIVQTKVRDWLIDYVKCGGTVFLNTHLLENAQRLCNKAAIIHNGKIQSIISLKDLKRQDINLEQLFHEIIT